MNIRHAAPLPVDTDATQLAKGFPWLRFAPRIEQEYQAHLVQAQRSACLICGTMALTVWSIFACFDIIRVTDLALWHRIDTTVMIWLFSRWIVLVMLAGGLCFIRFSTRNYSSVSFTLYVALGSAATIASHMASRKGAASAETAQIIIVMAAFLPLGFTFYRSLLAAFIVDAVSIAAVLYLGGEAGLVDRLQLVVILFLAVPVAAIGGYLREHSERRQFLLMRVLDHQASTDPLTGIANRRHFTAHAERIVAQAQRAGRSVTLAVADIDFFKQFNDVYGHMEGDTAIRCVAAALMHCSRQPMDLVARVGGEEFCVLLKGLSREAAEAVLADACARVRETCVPHTGSPHARLTISMGATMLREGDDLSRLLRRADRALYAAKAAGRDRLEWA